MRIAHQARPLKMETGNHSPALLLSFLLAFLLVSSCGKPKTVTPPPPAVQAPVPKAPEIKLAIQPALIRSGESATLTWESRNADVVTIDGGIGNVPLQGSRTVTPKVSTLFTATAQGGGKTATAQAEIKVQEKPAPPPPPPVQEKEANVTIEELFSSKIKDVFFEYDRYELSQDAVNILYANASFLREHAELNFVIGGHCDERGTAEYNLALGERRAKVVRDFLVNLGIEPKRITGISYGEEKPFATGNTEEAYMQNRRAHFSLNTQ